ncbi:MAG TPA: hypothetical protein VHL31_21900 [Geminicoccus sp.]|jgi:hypothetical protein|uniref:hypothetical protein n=1 Tax=Geminicoccus sp. TaxID=2024832 RepID=UPI002E380FD1|nr:hypothetical protein [Geminicoccus sp.]HEX2528934.1 hypothetical protein [Geminicoccus sp.]
MTDEPMDGSLGGDRDFTEADNAFQVAVLPDTGDEPFQDPRVHLPVSRLSGQREQDPDLARTQHLTIPLDPAGQAAERMREHLLVSKQSLVD